MLKVRRFHLGLREDGGRRGCVPLTHEEGLVAQWGEPHLQDVHNAPLAIGEPPLLSRTYMEIEFVFSCSSLPPDSGHTL